MSALFSQNGKFYLRRLMNTLRSKPKFMFCVLLCWRFSCAKCYTFFTLQATCFHVLVYSVGHSSLWKPRVFTS